MRNKFYAIGTGVAAFVTSFLATSHCCERVNFLAAAGLAQPGCLGLAQYKTAFSIASIGLLAATIGLSLYGPGASPKPSFAGIAALTLLVTTAGLFLFVLP